MRSVASSRAGHPPAETRGWLDCQRDVETRVASRDANWRGAENKRSAQTSSRRSETTTLHVRGWPGSAGGDHADLAGVVDGAADDFVGGLADHEPIVRRQDDVGVGLRFDEADQVGVE